MSIATYRETRLRSSCGRMVEAHPGQSGVFALQEGLDAFAARVLLAGAAEHTLDVQYYIWHHDMSGTLLLEALHRAADRGVRVRLLLDDNNTAGLDPWIAALDAHANIEVRLFNPFKHRRWRLLDYVVDFARANRRMHNKSFTADGQATIIGGRNVGDEYFGAGQDISFVDLDVIAVGPVVEEVSRDFERYWTSGSAISAAVVVPPAAESAIADIGAAAHRVEHDPLGVKYIHAVAGAPFVRDLLEGNLRLEWATVHMVSDDPAKGLARATDDSLLWNRLKEIIAVLRARCGGRAGAEQTRARGREDHRADERARGNGCPSGPRRLRQTPETVTCRGHQVVRAEAPRRRPVAARIGVDGKLVVEPARQDFRSRPHSALRRLLQLRSSVGSPEYGDGLRDREYGARERSGQCMHAACAGDVV